MWTRKRLVSRLRTGRRKRRRITTIWRYRTKMSTGRMMMKKRKCARRPRRKFPRTLDLSRE